MQKTRGIEPSILLVKLFSADIDKLCIYSNFSHYYVCEDCVTDL